MATIRPFRALRPAPEAAAEVASVPYDVVDSREARILAQGNPRSFLHVIRPEIDLPACIDPYDQRVYAKAAENLDSFIGKGILLEEGESCVYLYRLEEEGRSQIGIAACCAVDDYDNDVIKKHEHTRKEKEDDRVRHMLALSAHAGPVLMTFRSTEAIAAMVRSGADGDPLYDFTAIDGVRHTLWRIENADGLVSAFANIPAVYIADGHHRAAGASRVREAMAERADGLSGEEECNFFLAVLFPSDQLRILAYNRYVSELNGMSSQEFLKVLEERFSLSEGGPEPCRKGEFGMFLEGGWRILTPRREFLEKIGGSSPVDDLDLSVFQALLLSPLLGITDQKKDRRIQFVGGADSVRKLESMVEEAGGAAFTLFPVAVEELLAIADAEEIMPPKSTWFSPKLRSGLLTHRF